ncbi:MAG TPA: YciI family protein [Steroidobacteraceae bacterium]|jgi:hypothetical protein
MSEFVVLLHEDPGVFARLSPAEMQQVLQKYRAWFEKLGATGKMQVSKKLTDEGGRQLRGKRGSIVVSDGPFAEAKDVVAGLFIVQAASYDEARSLLNDCPHFDYDGWIELRQIDSMGK